MMFDAIVYINLEHRLDRRKHIEDQLKVFHPIIAQRFSAIKNKDGYIGCAQSHIAVLELALEKKWKTVFVVEDDFCWNSNADFTKLQTFVSNPFDVIQVCPDSAKYDIATRKLTKTYSTAGYIVAQDYIPVLLCNFKEGLYNLQKSYHKANKFYGSTSGLYTIDNYWNHIIPTGNWYCLPFAYQIPSYSDIETRVVDRTKLYNKE